MKIKEQEENDKRVLAQAKTDYESGKISITDARSRIEEDTSLYGDGIAEAAPWLAKAEKEERKKGRSAKKKEAEAPQTAASQEAAPDFQALKDKYRKGKSAEGGEDEIYIGGETLSGRWKMVEAQSPSASHDEKTFRKTPGFPKNEDGSTVNDRDYQADRAAQETVLSIAANFNGHALSFDSPVVVTQDGVVVSGNNRTMSSKLAAEKGTDGAYIETLR